MLTSSALLSVSVPPKPHASKTSGRADYLWGSILLQLLDLTEAAVRPISLNVPNAPLPLLFKRSNRSELAGLPIIIIGTWYRKDAGQHAENLMIFDSEPNCPQPAH